MDARQKAIAEVLQRAADSLAEDCAGILPSADARRKADAKALRALAAAIERGQVIELGANDRWSTQYGKRRVLVIEFPEEK